MDEQKQSGAIRKFISKLMSIFAIGIIVYWCVLFLNNLWYESKIPRNFDARWEGEFVSIMHPTSGKLLARLPDPIPRDQEFEFEAVVYYNIWSFFLTGKMARADFVGYVGSKGGLTTGKETRPTVSPRHFSFSLKGGGSQFPHDIKYTSTFDLGDQYVAGSYSVQYGMDIGYFSLKKF